MSLNLILIPILKKRDEINLINIIFFANLENSFILSLIIIDFTRNKNFYKKLKFLQLVTLKNTYVNSNSNKWRIVNILHRAIIIKSTFKVFLSYLSSDQLSFSSLLHLPLHYSNFLLYSDFFQSLFSTYVLDFNPY